MGPLKIGGRWICTRRVELVPDTFTMPAEMILLISGFGTQVEGFTLKTVLSNVMSLAVPATSRPISDVVIVAVMSTPIPARPMPLLRSILMVSGVGVTVGVSVGVAVSVTVGVSVGVSVGVTVGVLVTVGVAVGVSVLVGVLVRVSGAVAVGV